MIAALDRNGNKVLASEVPYGNRGDYFCPFCGEPVYVTHGEIKRDYFAHYPRSKCGYKEWEPETREHIEMKEYFYRKLKNAKWVRFVEVERVIGSNVADVYVETVSGKSIAIECQVSRCSYRRIDDKTKAYVSNDVSVIWIAHNKGSIRLRPIEIFGRKVVCRFGKKPYLVDVFTGEKAEVDFDKEPEFAGGVGVFSPKGDFVTVRRRVFSLSDDTRDDGAVEDTGDALPDEPAGEIFDVDDVDVVVDANRVSSARVVRCSGCKTALFRHGTLHDYSMVIETCDGMVIECRCGRKIMVKGWRSEVYDN